MSSNKTIKKLNLKPIRNNESTPKNTGQSASEKHTAITANTFQGNNFVFAFFAYILIPK